MEKIYNASIGTKVWITRDDYKESDVQVWIGKPKKKFSQFTVKYSYYYGSKLIGSKLIVPAFCHEQFAKITGCELKPGECVGPVYIGVLEP